jgi:hypothetical protein
MGRDTIPKGKIYVYRRQIATARIEQHQFSPQAVGGMYRGRS